MRVPTQHKELVQQIVREAERVEKRKLSKVIVLDAAGGAGTSTILRAASASVQQPFGGKIAVRHVEFQRFGVVEHILRRTQKAVGLLATIGRVGGAVSRSLRGVDPGTALALAGFAGASQVASLGVAWSQKRSEPNPSQVEYLTRTLRRTDRARVVLLDGMHEASAYHHLVQIASIVRAAAAPHALLVISGDSTESEFADAILAVRNSIQSGQQLSELKVGRLTCEDVAALISPVEKETAKLLHDFAAGSLDRVVELWRLWRELKVVERRGWRRRWRMVEKLHAGTEAEAMITRCIERPSGSVPTAVWPGIDNDARQFTFYAAHCGQVFDPELVYAAFGSKLSPAEKRMILALLSRGPNRIFDPDTAFGGVSRCISASFFRFRSRELAAQAIRLNGTSPLSRSVKNGMIRSILDRETVDGVCFVHSRIFLQLAKGSAHEEAAKRIRTRWEDVPDSALDSLLRESIRLASLPLLHVQRGHELRVCDAIERSLMLFARSHSPVASSLGHVEMQSYSDTQLGSTFMLTDGAGKVLGSRRSHQDLFLGLSEKQLSIACRWLDREAGQSVALESEKSSMEAHRARASLRVSGANLTPTASVRVRRLARRCSFEHAALNGDLNVKILAVSVMRNLMGSRAPRVEILPWLSRALGAACDFSDLPSIRAMLLALRLTGQDVSSALANERLATQELSFSRTTLLEEGWRGLLCAGEDFPVWWNWVVRGQKGSVSHAEWVKVRMRTTGAGGIIWSMTKVAESSYSSTDRAYLEHVELLLLGSIYNCIVGQGSVEALKQIGESCNVNRQGSDLSGARLDFDTGSVVPEAWPTTALSGREGYTQRGLVALTIVHLAYDLLNWREVVGVPSERRPE